MDSTLRLVKCDNWCEFDFSFKDLFLFELCRGKERHKSSVSSFLQWSQQLDLGQAKARSLPLFQGLPTRAQWPMCLDHLLLSQPLGKELGRKWSSWGPCSLVLHPPLPHRACHVPGPYELKVWTWLHSSQYVLFLFKHS